MSDPLANWGFWIILTIQIAGILATGLARLGEGSSWQTCCQRLYFASLALVGLVTVVGIGCNPGYWMASGTTLSIMIVSAVFDRGGLDKAVVW